MATMSEAELRARVRAIKPLCRSLERRDIPPEEFIANLGVLVAGLLSIGDPEPVFCGYCVHYASGYSDREYEHCAKAKTRNVTTQNHRERRTTAVAETPAEKNAGNDCREFKSREATY